MPDILGPASAPNAVTVRPSEARSFSLLDSWFKDCSSPTVEDGTDLQANFLNGLLAALRKIWRMNGKLADNATPVVPEIGSDDNGLAAALAQFQQRGLPNYAEDTGGANAIVIDLVPTPAELKAGLFARVKIKAANTGATTIVVNGSAPIAVKHPNGAGLATGDLIANGIAFLVYDGTVFQLAASHTDKNDGGGGGGSGGAWRLPYAVASGTATAITADYSPDVPTPVPGDLFSVRLAANIAGPTTFNPDGLGAHNLYDAAGAELAADFAKNGELIVMECVAAGKMRIISKPAPSTAQAVMFPAVGSYFAWFGANYTPGDNIILGTGGAGILIPGTATPIPGVWKVLRTDLLTFVSNVSGDSVTTTNTWHNFVQRIS